MFRRQRETVQALREVVAEARARTGDHPSPEALLAYHDRELPAARAESIRDHLSVCPSCVQLVIDLAAFPGLRPRPPAPDLSPAEVGRRWGAFRGRLAAEGLLPAAPAAENARRGARHPRSRLLPALAALSLLTTIGLGLWAGLLHRRLAELSRPHDDVHLVDLVPITGRVQRGLEPGPVAAAAASERLLLLLNLFEPRDDPGYRIEIFAGDEEGAPPVWSRTGVRRAADGNFVLALPPGFLRPGEHRIVVSAGAGGSYRVLATYQLVLTP